MVNSHDSQTAEGEDLFGRSALFAQGAQAEGIMALGETNSRGIAQQFAMEVSRDWQAERANQQQLPRGGFEQIGPANYLGDLHGGIVHDDRELIGGNVIATPDNEVAEVVSHNVGLRTEALIVKTNRL